MNAYQSKHERDERFLCIVYHLLSMDEIRPIKLLSSNFKALNLLKFRHCSYIVFVKSLQVMKVSSTNTNKVTVVMNVNEKTYKEFLSQNDQVVIFYLLERLDQLKMQKEVKIIEILLLGSREKQVPYFIVAN